ncbi:MAG: SCP2 sterol-binding domain-containing protein [Xanthomonadaceae bacterium]|jgi:ubiquinone biosynthesis protein UbiJ|nr:SCP2 sterol-binding domain-containing protein [Xanthomonadaceae bacterium]
MPLPLDILKPLAGRVLESALNRILALDPETQQALDALNGRRVSLALESPPLALELRVRGGRLKVGPPSDTAEKESDLAVRSTLGGLLAQLPFFAGPTDTRDAAQPTGRVRLSGDAELARHLQTLATRFNPDWQRPFVTMFGEVIGVQVANAVKDGLRRLRDTAEDLAHNAVEYATEESRTLVGVIELNAFYDDVEGLHDDVERLDMRVARLWRKAGGME